MGKAASELPADTLDPTEMSEKAAAAVDVDELLAQMAGEEIDRLLSEADDPHDRPAKASSPAVTPTPEPAPVVETIAPPAAEATAEVDEAVSRQLDELFEAATAGDDAAAEAPAPEPVAPVAAIQPPSPTPPPAPASAPAAPGADDPLAKQLDDLFAQLEGGGSPAAPEAAPAVAQAPAPVAAPTVAPPAPSVVEEPAATSALERSALDAPMPAVEILVEGHEAEDESLPWYLKPLEWINAPLDSLPDPLRELIGKLGLLTLFNACAVLVYVYVFRKHHH